MGDDWGIGWRAPLGQRFSEGHGDGIEVDKDLPMQGYEAGYLPGLELVADRFQAPEEVVVGHDFHDVAELAPDHLEIGPLLWREGMIFAENDHARQVHDFDFRLCGELGAIPLVQRGLSRLPPPVQMIVVFL